jgi:hypothetical protein
VSRVQLALNVVDLDQAIALYSKLFATEPANVRPGYADFAVADPPLKLALIEDATLSSGSLNHLGVEVGSTDELMAARSRLVVAIPKERGLDASTEFPKPLTDDEARAADVVVTMGCSDTSPSIPASAISNGNSKTPPGSRRAGSADHR